MPDVENAAEDDFGDFGDVNAADQKTIENGTSNPHDDLELTSPDARQQDIGSTPSLSSPPDVPSGQESDHAEAGDNGANEKADTMVGGDDDIDFFGNFGRAQQQQPNVSNALWETPAKSGIVQENETSANNTIGQQHPTEDELKDEGNDDFGLFLDSPQQPEDEDLGTLPETTNSPLSTRADQECGNAEGVETVAVTGDGKGITTADDGEDTDFGDFDDGQQTEIQPTEPIGSDEGDDFGDFGTAAPQVEQPIETGDNATSEQLLDSAKVYPAFDDSDVLGEFGDFDTVQSELIGETMPSNGIDPDNANSGQAHDSEQNLELAIDQMEPAAVAGGDKDEFGGYGDFDSSPAEAVPSYEPDAGNLDSGQTLDSHAMGSAPGEDEGEFGDFGSSSPEEVPPNGTDVGNVDSGQTPDSETMRPDVVAIGDDDFGDFGDFDSAPQAQQQPVQSTPSADSDFGDFDSVPAEPVASDDNDDFGDFGSAEDAGPETRASAEDGGFAANFDNGPVDPILQTARTVCAKVFEGYAADPTDISTDSYENETIESLLSSIERGNLTEEAMDSPKQLLIAILNDTTTLTKAPSTIIVASADGYSTNAHFGVPVGGGGDESAFLGEEVLGRRQATRTDGISEGVSSSIASPPDVANQPINKAPNAPSTSSLQILQQIPNLSFMLESKLVLPPDTN